MREEKECKILGPVYLLGFNIWSWTRWLARPAINYFLASLIATLLRECTSKQANQIDDKGERVKKLGPVYLDLDCRPGPA